MDSTKVIEKEYALIDEIKKMKEYIDLVNAYNNLMNDEESRKLIDEFNDAKRIEKVSSTKENILYLSNKKKNLYTNKLYIEYVNKLKIFNDSVSEIEKKINDFLYPIEFNELFKKGL